MVQVGAADRRLQDKAVCQNPGVRHKLFLCYQVLVQNFEEYKNSKFKLGLSDHYEIYFSR